MLHFLCCLVSLKKHSLYAEIMGRCSTEIQSSNGISLGTFLFVFVPVFLNISFVCVGTSQLGEACDTSNECEADTYCANCTALGENQSVCVRGQALIPTTYIDGLPFNKYTWLMTHNAFSIVGSPLLTGAERITFYNQEDSVTNQLGNGVRGLMLDMYDFEDDVWLCHSFNGQCFNFTAFRPAIDTLREVEAFLSQNPFQIVTIIIEDYVHSPKGLSKVFTAAGLDKYWFPVSNMPKKGDDWPTLPNMIHKNQRLLVFTSDSSKEADEGIAYQWSYMVENKPGDPGIAPGSCHNRNESKPFNSKSSSLFLMNYFPTIPVQADDACKEHSAPLAVMIGTCYKASGNVMPNFVAVNYYMRSDGGGVFDDIDRMNGQTLCGCGTVTQCQAGAPRGACKNIPPSHTAAPGSFNSSGSFAGSVQLKGYSSKTYSPKKWLVAFLFLLSLI